jgi:hypothetical protein
MKIGYKTFEYVCDLRREVARLRTWEAQHALDQAQDRVGWPWCLTQEQIDDWNALHRHLDPPQREETRR